MKGFTTTNMWSPPGGQTSNIGLGYVEGAGGVPVATVVPAMSATFLKLFGAGNPVASHAEKVCDGTLDAWYFENNMTFGALNLVSEATVALGKSRLFEAVYTRQSSTKEDPDARKALDTLCIKS